MKKKFSNSEGWKGGIYCYPQNAVTGILKDPINLSNQLGSMRTVTSLISFLCTNNTPQHPSLWVKHHVSLQQPHSIISSAKDWSTASPKWCWKVGDKELAQEINSPSVTFRWDDGTNTLQRGSNTKMHSGLADDPSTANELETEPALVGAITSFLRLCVKTPSSPFPSLHPSQFYQMSPKKHGWMTGKT